MWYVDLRRDQHYLRSYRTNNLWLDIYNKKMRTPKINAWHVAVIRRMSKSLPGVSIQIINGTPRLEKQMCLPYE